MGSEGGHALNKVLFFSRKSTPLLLILLILISVALVTGINETQENTTNSSTILNETTPVISNTTNTTNTTQENPSETPSIFATSIIQLLLRPLQVLQGELIQITGILITENTSLPDQQVQLLQNNSLLLENTTYPNGSFLFALNSAMLPAGNYALNVSYPGIGGQETIHYQPSSAVSFVEILPVHEEQDAQEPQIFNTSNTTITTVNTTNATVTNITTNTSNTTLNETNITIQEWDEQLPAQINAPVQWKRIILFENPTNQRQQVMHQLQLPPEAERVVVDEYYPERAALLQRMIEQHLHQRDNRYPAFLLSRNVPQEGERIEILYETPAPQKFTRPPLQEGSTWKQDVTIASEASIHYHNVLTTLEIRPSLPETIRLYWHGENGLVEVTENSSYNLSFNDTNQDGLVDELFWIVPQLSNQTFTVETELMVLNLQSYPTVGGNWTVEFTTLGTADLRITPVYGTSWSTQAHTGTDLQYLSVVCGETVLEPIWEGATAVFENYSCTELGTETSRVFTTGKHVLEFQFGPHLQYANNSAEGLCAPNCPTSVIAESGRILLTSASQTISLDNTYNFSKAFVSTRYSQATSTNNPAPSTGTVQTVWGTNMDELVATRYAATSNTYLSYSIIQSDNIQVYNFTNTWTAGGGTSETVTLEEEIPLDYQTKCFVQLKRNTRVSGSDTDCNGVANVRAELSDNQTVQLDRQITGGCTSAGLNSVSSGYVVCFLDETNVTHFELYHAASTQTDTHTLATPVDQSSSYIVASFMHSDDGVSQNNARFNFTADDQVSSDRGSGFNAGTLNASVYVVEFETGKNARVLHNQTFLTAAIVSTTMALGETVDENHTILECTNDIRSGTGTNHYKEWWTYDLIGSGTTISADKTWAGGTNQDTDISCQTVVWPNLTSFETGFLRPNITLLEPVNERVFNVTSVNFTFNLTVDDTLQNCSLWTNESGSFSLTQYNQTTMQNNSNNSINHTFSQDGEYLWNIQCWDDEYGFALANNTVFIDRNPPEVTILSITPSPANHTFSSVEINWSVVDQHPNTSFINLSYPNGSLVNTFYTNITITPENFTVPGNYTIFLYARDSGGNENTTSTILEVLDVTPPTVTLLSPANESFDNDGNLDFNYTITDYSSTQSCTLYFSGTGVSTNSSINDTLENQSFLQTGLGDGDYFWSVNCTDVHANEGGSEVWQITVDTENPTVTLQLPTDTSWDLDGTVQFNATPTDDHLDTCILYADFGGPFVANETISSPISGVLNNFPPLNLIDGSYLWNVWCNDSATNTQFAVANYTVNIDTAIPVVEPLIPSNGSWQTTNNIEFTYNLTEANEDVCQLWGNFSGFWALNQTDTSPREDITNNFNDLVTLADGSYYWNVWCNDTAGNSQFNNTNITFFIDTQPSVIQLETPANASWDNDGAVLFNATVLEKNPSVCQLWGNFSGTWELNQTNTTLLPDGSVQFSPLALADGIYYWNVWCNDSASQSAVNATNYTIGVDTITPLVGSAFINDTNLSINRYVCLNVTANDSFSRVQSVYAEVLYPVSGLLNVSLSNSSGSCGGAGGQVWSVALQASEEGTYNWTETHVYDAAGNLNTTIPVTLLNWSAISVNELSISLDVPLSPLEINESESNTYYNQTCTLTCLSGSCDDATITPQYYNGTWNDVTPTSSGLIANESAYVCGDLVGASSWWNNDYIYRQQLNISNPNTETSPLNYTYNFSFDTESLVSAGKLNANCSDLRIIYWNGTGSTELDRINTTSCNISSTDILFRSPIAIAQDSFSFYLYYGNPSANVPPQNPDNVYLFYDDFESETTGVQPSKWSLGNGDWDVELNGSNRVLRSEDTVTGYDRLWVTSNPSDWGNVSIEFDMFLSNLAGGIEFAGVLFRRQAAAEDEHLALVGDLRDATDTIMYRRWDGGYAVISGDNTVYSTNQWYTFQIRAVEDHVRMYRSGTNYIDYNTTAYWRDGGGLGVMSYDDNSMFDNIKVRYDLHAEPKITMSAEENTSQFTTNCSFTFEISADVATGSTMYPVRCQGSSSSASNDYTTSTNITINDAPVPSLYSPLNDSWINGLSLLNGSLSSDDQGIGLYTFLLDNTTQFSSPSTICSSLDANCTLNTSAQTQCIEESKTCFILLNVTDSDGLSNTTFITVGIDNTGPTSTMYSPLSGHNMTIDTQLLEANVSDGGSGVDTVFFSYRPNATEPWESACTDTNSFPYFCVWDMTALPDSRFYELRVSANDSLNNVGGYDTITEITLDRVPPEITLLAPENDSWEGENISFVYQVNDSTVNVTSCVLIVNGSNNATETSITEEINQTFSVTYWGDGDYLWSIRCTDNVGNSNTTINRTVHVDTIGPEVTIDQPPSFANISESPFRIDVTANDAGSGVDTVFFYYRPNETESWTFLAIDASAPYRHNWDTGSLAEGKYYEVRALANDSRNITGSIDIATNITIDRTAPNITLILPLNETQDVDGLVTFNFSVTDALTELANCSLLINDTINQTNTSIVQNQTTLFTTQFANGTYNWSIQCVDYAENSGVSVTYDLLVAPDTDAPIVNLTSPPNNSTDTDGDITFVYTVADTLSDLANCTLFVNGTVNDTDTTINQGTNSFFVQDITDGSYNWSVACYDNASTPNQGTSLVWNVSVLHAETIFVNLTADQGSYEEGEIAFIFTNTTDVLGNAINTTVDQVVILGNTTDPWFNSGWEYRQQLFVEEQSGADLVVYQVNLSLDTESLVSAGKMESSCVDIRFTDDQNTLLPHWIESGCNTTSTVAWVQMNLTASQNSTLYWYYGNPSATNTSNMSATMGVVQAGATSTDQDWTTITTERNYFDPVVTVSAHYSSGTPRGAWVQNKTGKTFEVSVNDANNPTATTTAVHYLAMENGTWQFLDGTLIEAGTESSVTDVCYNGYFTDYTTVQFGHAFASTPAITHSRASSDDSDWGVTLTFFPGNRDAIPNATHMALCLNRGQLGASPMTDDIDWIAAEAEQDGTLQGSQWETQVSTDTIEGCGEAGAPYDEPWRNTYISAPEVAVLGQLLEDGGNGAWAVGWQIDAADAGMCVDETEITDRQHATEQVGIIAFEYEGVYPLRQYVSTHATFSYGEENQRVANRTVITDTDGETLWEWSTFGFAHENYTSLAYATNPNYNPGWDYVQFSIIPDTTNPNISLVTPLNDTWWSVNDLNVTYLPYDNGHHYTNCSLILNNGINQTNTTIIDNTSNQFTLLALPETYYNWSVVCFDAAENQNTSTQYTFTIDRTAPTPTLLNPTPFTNSSVSNVTFNISLEDNLDTLLQCNLTVDGLTVQEAFNATNGTFTERYHNLTYGNHSWNVTCWDNANNSQTSTTQSVFVDTRAPIVNLIAPGNATGDADGTVQMQFSVVDDRPLNCSLYGNFSGSFEINETLYTLTNDTTTAFTSINLPEGDYAWNVFCFDSAGNSAFNSTNYSLYVDQTWPEIQYGEGTEENNTFFARNFIYINVSAYDVHEEDITFFVYDAAMLPYSQITLPAGTRYYNFTPVNPDKVYWYDVRIDDLAGHQNTTPKRKITLDNTNPTITLNQPANASYSNSSSVQFNFTPTDANLDLCQLWGNFSGSWAWNQTNTTVSSGVLNSFMPITLTDGTYLWGVFCNDSAQNLNWSTNNSLTVDTLHPVLSFIEATPNDNFNQTNRTVILNISHTELNPDSLLLYWNGSLNTTQAYTGSETTLTLTNLSDGLYTYYVWINDSARWQNQTETRTLRIDNQPPRVTLIDPTNETWIADTGSTVSFAFNVSDNLLGLSQCSLIINNTVNVTNTTIATGVTQYIEQTFTTGNYSWSINCTDQVGNENSSLTREIFVDRTYPQFGSFGINSTESNVKTDVCFNLTVNDTISGLNSVWINITDPDGFIQQVTLYNNESVSCDSGIGDGVYSRVWNLPKVGSYNWTAGIANDVAGNYNFTVIGNIFNATATTTMNVTLVSPLTPFEINESSLVQNYSFTQTCNIQCYPNPTACADVSLYVVYNGTETGADVNTTSLDFVSDEDGYFCGDLPNSTGWWDDGYAYKQLVNITNNDVAVLQEGSTVNITIDTEALITANKLQLGCDDLRIVYNNTLELDRINVSACNQTDTTFMFRLQENVSTESTDYALYYGNTTVTTPPTNKSLIYYYWEDFEDQAHALTFGSLNPSVIGGAAKEGSYGLSGDGQASYYRAVVPENLSRGYTFSGWVSPRTSGVTSLAALSFGQGTTGCGTAERCGYQSALDQRSGTGGSSDMQLRENYGSGEVIGSSTANTVVANDWYYVNTWWKSDGEIIVQVYNTSFSHWGTFGANDSSYTTGYYGVGSYQNTYWDNLALQRITDVVPTVSSGTEETNPTNTTCEHTFTIHTGQNAGAETYEFWCEARSSNVGDYISPTRVNVSVNDRPVPQWINPLYGDWIGGVTLLNGSLSSDDQGIGLYTFLLDNTTQFSSPSTICSSADANCTLNTSAQTQCLEESTICYLQLNTTDTDGLSNISTIQIGIDNIGPSVTLDLPLNNTFIVNASYMVNATVTDLGSGIDTVTFLFRPDNSTPWSSACVDDDATVPHNCSWDTSVVADSTTYEILVYANDSLNNVGNNDTHGNITVDRSGPVITIVAPDNNTLNVRGNITFNYSVNDISTSVANCSLLLNDVINQTNQSTEEIIPQFFSFDDLPDGQYNWSIQCTDTLGNTNTSAKRNLTVIPDTFTPTVTNIDPVNNETVTSTTVIFSYNVTDQHADITNCSLYLDDALNTTRTDIVEATTQTFTVTNVPDGNYSWFVMCYDTADLSNNASSSLWNFTVLETVSLLVNISKDQTIVEAGELVNFTTITTDVFDNLLVTNVSLAIINDTTSLPWWNGSFTRRQAMNISNGLSRELLYGTPINVTIDTETLVNASLSQEDGEDLRIVYWNATSFIWEELDRQLFGMNTTTTQVMFQLQTNISVGGYEDQYYYIYYDNATVTNPPNTTENIRYMLVDGFDENTLSMYDYRRSFDDTNEDSSTTVVYDELGWVNYTATSGNGKSLRPTSHYGRNIKVSVAQYVEDWQSPYAKLELGARANTTDYYYVWLSTNIFDSALGRYDDGSDTVLATSSIKNTTKNIWHILSFSVTDNTSTVFLDATVDGLPLLAYNDSSADRKLDYGQFGFGAFQLIGKWDNFTVERIGVGNPTMSLGPTQSIVGYYENDTLGGSSVATWNTTGNSLGWYSAVALASRSSYKNGYANITFELVDDQTLPTIILNAPVQDYNTTNTSILFNWTVFDNVDSTITCNLSINGITNVSSLLTNRTTPLTATVENISAGRNNWSVLCTDALTNANVSSVYNFTIVVAPENIFVSVVASDNTSTYLNWSAAPYATTYAIYMSNNHSQFSSTPNVTGIADLNWTDTTADHVVKRFYRVGAWRGSAGAVNVTTYGKHSLYLPAGWNLVSTPLQLANWTLRNATVEGYDVPVVPGSCLEQIWKYNATASDPWELITYDAGNWLTAIGDENFTELAPGEGYWVYNNESLLCNITFAGQVPLENTTKALYADENIIGWYAETSPVLPIKPYGDYIAEPPYTPFTGVPTAGFSYLYRFNATTQLWQATQHIFPHFGWWPDSSSADFTTLEPTRGYYLELLEIMNWTIESE